MTEEAPLATGSAHLSALKEVLECLDAQVDRADAWGRRLAEVLPRGARLLAVGNGGSAAQAQHLTGELVGRYRDDRRSFSALALHSDTSSTTAIGNDYGPEEMFARQVGAHGREGDVLVALSTSGASANVLAAVERAREVGMSTWGLTGALPNPLAAACEESIAIDCSATATIQEAHLIAIHLICASLDCALGVSSAFPSLRVAN